jgi:1,4-dihydroxy-6-naphthoate synthase
MIRVGISPCPNDVFIFSGWILGKTPAPAATFFYEDVETLNGLARGGDRGSNPANAGDLLKVSWANVPGCSGYAPLACGGALGRGCGPLLLTGGADFDPDAEVLVPGARTTANRLLDFWAGRPLRKRFVPFDALYRELKADPKAQGVVIHEMRFTYARDGLRLVRDLGAHWEEKTGSPIPLGALVRRDSPDVPSAAELESAVRASLDWAWAHEEEAMALCARHAQDMTPEVMRAHVALYVNAFSREMGEEGWAAVRTLTRHTV